MGQIVPKKSSRRQKTDKDEAKNDTKEQNSSKQKKGAKTNQTVPKTADKETKEKEKTKSALAKEADDDESKSLTSNPSPVQNDIKKDISQDTK